MCRNIAEGFCRYESGEIVQFFRYALASLAEVQDHLEECRARRFVEDPDFARLWDVSEHAKALSLNFMKPHAGELRRRRENKGRRSSGAQDGRRG